MNKTEFKLPIGSSNFKEIVTESDFFADQTILIKEVLDSGYKAILITKPRRWGKTSAQDMLNTFFSIEVDDNGQPKTELSNRILFTGGATTGKQLEPLQISTIDDGKYMNYQGKYPVIFISFKDVKGLTNEGIEICLMKEIVNLVKAHRYLTKSSKLSKDEITYLQKFIDDRMEMHNLKDSLKEISRLLSKHHGKNTYVLIDEYDKPVSYLLERSTSLKEPDIIRNTAELVSGILSRVGKDNNYLEKIIMTGIYDTVKKEGNSGFNNVNAYGISDAQFSSSFGFSQQNVDELITKMGFNETEAVVKANIKDWYNGYLVPSGPITMENRYTPWAVVKYLNDAQKGFLKPKNYWSQTGAAIIIQDLLKSSATEKTILKLIHLTQGKQVILDGDSYASLFRYNLSSPIKAEKLITYLLLNSGYITLVKGTDDKYQIPNPIRAQIPAPII
ncbi:MAG: AAA family ATPase, partial [Pseudomonadota bacterium]